MDIVKVQKKQILKVCAWCSPQNVMDNEGNVLRGLTANDKQTFMLSHGMCKSCAVAFEEKEDAKYATPLVSAGALYAPNEDTFETIVARLQRHGRGQ